MEDSKPPSTFKHFSALETGNAAGVAEINQEILTQWLAGQDSAVTFVVLDCIGTRLKLIERCWFESCSCDPARKKT